MRNHKAPPAVAPRPWRAETLPAGGSLLDAVRTELEAAGRLDSWRGQLALLLAERMCGRETGAAMAALSRELSRVMAEAVGVAPAADELDELRVRRESKRA